MNFGAKIQQNYDIRKFFVYFLIIFLSIKFNIMINLLKIKELSKSKKMTLEELADKVGMTKQGIYNLMSKNTCNFSTLSKIAEALGVSESVFFDSNTQ